MELLEHIGKHEVEPNISQRTAGASPPKGGCAESLFCLVAPLKTEPRMLVDVVQKPSQSNRDVINLSLAEHLQVMM
jgi:hypothetical protein